MAVGDAGGSRPDAAEIGRAAACQAAADRGRGRRRPVVRDAGGRGNRKRAGIIDTADGRGLVHRFLKVAAVWCDGLADISAEIYDRSISWLKSAKAPARIFAIPPILIRATDHRCRRVRWSTFPTLARA